MTHLPAIEPGCFDEAILELRELVRWCDGMVWSSPETSG